MKNPLTTISSFGAFGLLSSFAFAGSVAIDPAAPAATASADGFAQARRPISNPTLFDLALPTTNVHPLFIYHSLPDSIQTRLGNLPLGGDVELYALQFEIAINDRLSIVATKDGYVEVNPDSTASSESGFADLGAGLKYAFILDPVSQTALSGTLTFELPTGNSDVFQGEGRGAANLIVSGLKLVDDWQFAAGAGARIPFSDEQSTEGWLSAHASYEISRYFIPLVEMNWFHVIESGNGTGNYPSQVGGAIPAVVEFEGGDLFNLGAANSHANRDLVTAAFGFRSRICNAVDAGMAYEIPLTNDETSLMENRVTVDLVWRF
ncbi:MAG: transporter [Verrucomicrobiota bacterium]